MNSAKFYKASYDQFQMGMEKEDVGTSMMQLSFHVVQLKGLQDMIFIHLLIYI